RIDGAARAGGVAAPAVREPTGRRRARPPLPHGDMAALVLEQARAGVDEVERAPTGVARPRRREEHSLGEARGELGREPARRRESNVRANFLQSVSVGHGATLLSGKRLSAPYARRRGGRSAARMRPARACALPGRRAAGGSYGWRGRWRASRR